MGSGFLQLGCGLSNLSFIRTECWFRNWCSYGFRKISCCNYSFVCIFRCIRYARLRTCSTNVIIYLTTLLLISACCNGDTWSSEIGSVVSKSEPIHIISWKKVPRGTNGGVSLIGILASIMGKIVLNIPLHLQYTISTFHLWNRGVLGRFVILPRYLFGIITNCV